MEIASAQIAYGLFCVAMSGLVGFVTHKLTKQAVYRDIERQNNIQDLWDEIDARENSLEQELSERFRAVHDELSRISDKQQKPE